MVIRHGPDRVPPVIPAAAGAVARPAADAALGTVVVELAVVAGMAVEPVVAACAAVVVCTTAVVCMVVPEGAPQAAPAERTGANGL